MTVRILIADDHELMREGLRTMLQKEPDFQIVGEAANGTEALQLTIDLEPDILVLDIAMPDINGIEVTEHLIEKGTSSRILALSMHSEKGFVSGMFAKGASGYILKDSALRELVKAIRTVVSGRRYLSPKLVEVVLDDISTPGEQADKSGTEVLTPREIEILKLIAEGNTSKEIAYSLDLSVRTVDAHRQQIMKKTGLNSIADLTKLAIREGLTKL